MCTVNSFVGDPVQADEIELFIVATSCFLLAYDDSTITVELCYFLLFREPCETESLAVCFCVQLEPGQGYGVAMYPFAAQGKR